MTEAERQTVIDALELFQQYLQAYDWHDPDDYSNAVEALAIMRRERGPAAVVLNGDDCFLIADDLPAGTKLYPE